MHNEQDALYIDELISTANLIELVRSTFIKIGLEYLPPVDEDFLDEIVSKEVNALTKLKGEGA